MVNKEVNEVKKYEFISPLTEKSKKGQSTLELPFQLIFSLILIAVFIYAAVTGIRYFLERADQAKIDGFIVDLGSKVNSAWQAIEISNVYSFDLPKNIKSVCFGDLGLSLKNSSCPEFESYRKEALAKGANMFFCPPKAAFGVGSPAYYKIDCNEGECLSAGRGVTCIKSDGKISLALEKKLGDSKVVISA